MKNVLIIISVLCFFSACRFKTGSGNIVTEKRSTSAFTGVNASGGFEIEIKNGPVEQVTVEADDNIIKDIETNVSDGQLKIRVRTNNLHDAHLKVFITAPQINKITASAGADITVKDELRSSDEINLQASSGSKIITALDAPSVSADASSAGDIEVSGRTKTFNVESSSGSSVKASQLLSENTIATASSGATANVHASVSLQANASSGGNINYKGGGSTKINQSSGGSVNKED
ncbi:MAG: head GIN domain-containing protein [Ferruginibacter sp.]